MRPKVEEFSLFYENWLTQLELHLQRLLVASSDKIQPPPSEPELRDLVSRLTAHHKEYYTEKWAAAHEDVFAFFTPAWATPLENSYSWLSGWKPSTAFRLVANVRNGGATALAGSSDELVRRIEQLRVKIRYEEEKVERELERQQVGLAERRLVELARLATGSFHEDVGGIEEGDVSMPVSGMVDAAVMGLAAGLERVMKAADCVRLKTLKGLLDLMSPLQCVEFLAAISMLHIWLRRSGQIHEQIITQNLLI